MSVRRCAAVFSSLALLAGLLFSGGCASQPPNQNTLSGKRLIVDMTFYDAVDPNQHYFFLINTSNNPNASVGPVPVLTFPYGNGFATGPGGTQGFTDFVEFDNQSTGYLLYHAVGDPNALSNLKSEGRPISYIIPDPSNAQTYNKLHFEIDLSQLIYDANGTPLTDQTTTVSQALAMKWIQVNIVATNHLAVDATTNASKLTDSIGDNRSSSGQNANSSFLTLDISTPRIYQNGDSTLSLVEPSEYDVVGGGNDTAIDLRDWKIEVRQE